MKEKESKKWKGKDWFDILTPKEFGGNVIAETPAIDSNALRGRLIGVNVSDLTGDKKKYHMKLNFKVNKIKDKKAYTEFHGFEVIREFLSRFVRKRSQRIDGTFKLKTKDNWELRIKILTVTLRKVERNIQKQIRKIVEEHIISQGKKTDLNTFVDNVIKGRYQKESRSIANRVYPVRFNEVAKIKVLKKPKV
ncbi:MAG: hypothetical protein ISS36_04640 [Candidatus Aenigmarchaeota archaeon]|nr:hypothetical protein [Candidatus Aenigmarchaeota archaeon]